MALVLQSPVTFSESSSSRWSASDLRILSNGVIGGVTLKALARGHMGLKRRDFSVSAKVRKGKKPWAQDSDPNTKGGVIGHPSSSKPLKKKPKPVTLDFEEPLIKQRNEIIELQKLSNRTGLDYTEQIIALEEKYQKTLTELYTHLTPTQRAAIARHPNRPTCHDHIVNICDKFIALGDRASKDDHSIVTGIGIINGRSFMFIGQQKGRNMIENIQRKFGMPTPHAKAHEMMKYAEHHGFPIVTFIDTDVKSEKLNEGEAMAFLGLKVPIVTIVIGEGGSGGALAIAYANKLLMLENSVYVASPKAAAAISNKTAKGAPKAAKKLEFTAQKLCKLQIADGIIPEALGGAHTDPVWTSQQIKAAILESMDELEKMGKEELMKHRFDKFRMLAEHQSSVSTEPEKKINMKKKDRPDPEIVSDKVLEGEVEKLREQIVQGKESSPSPIDKMKVDELNREIFKIIQDVIESSPDLKNKIEMLSLEVFKHNNAPDEESNDKIESLEKEIKQGVAEALMSSAMKEKYEQLQAELVKISQESIGNLTKESSSMV